MQFIKRNIKLFAISGKARSGKNEAAKIIEEYYKDKKCITISYGYYINAISIIFAIISIIKEKKYYSFITIILNIIMLIYYLIFFNNIAV